MILHLKAAAISEGPRGENVKSNKRSSLNSPSFYKLARRSQR